MKIAFYTLIASLAFCSFANAHPHAWIDVQTKLIFDDRQQLTAIQERWIFDEYYTYFALQDFDPNKNKKLDHEELVLLGTDNLKNLKDYHYYTSIDAAGQKLAFKAPEAIDSKLVQNNRIQLDFTLPLTAAIDPVRQAVSYRIYDPSYYIEMLHAEKNPIEFQASRIKCSYKLIKAKPDFSKMALASSLDKNTNVKTDGLGSYFAETVKISCP